MTMPAVQTEPGFPPHVELIITHNDFAGSYQTAAQWIADEEGRGDTYYEWAGPDEREKALLTGSVWIVQWYPDTPVGFYAVAASTFEAAMRRVNAP